MNIRIPIAAWLGVLFATSLYAAPLKIDFSRIDPDGDAPLQSGWQGFSLPATGSGEVARAFPSDALAGTGNSVTIGLSGNSHARDYAAATGIFAAQSDLLSDGPLLNRAGTLTVRIDGLLDGNYEWVSYHHTTQFGPSERPPATLFDVFLDDAHGQGQVLAIGQVMSENSSAQLTALTHSFTVSGGNTVSLHFVRGASEGPDDHFALPALELALSGPPPPPLILDQVLINEFAASNDRSFTDGDGNSSDWIEMWNSTTNSVNLDGWFLNTWPFPAVDLAPDEYWVIFASGQSSNTYVDAQAYHHTSFKLPKEGGTITLFDPNAMMADQVLAYPPQETDITYGRHGTNAPVATGYLQTPTPGAKNAESGFEGLVADTRFSPDRGFYDAPFVVTITSSTANATIYYTTDGSEPDENNGLTYAGPISVNNTTILRARATREGYRPTNIDTHTYLFSRQVVEQAANPEGFPTTWTGWDYGMEDEPAAIKLIAAGNTNLTESAAKAIIADALKALPSLSLSMNVDQWFDPAVGIYHNSTRGGATWERGCSAELIFPTNLVGTGFQIDCGVRVQGFTSRDPTRNPKHSLRLAFRGTYGATKLEYPWLGDEGPDAFDTIVLRSNSQDAWVYNAAGNRVGQFIRDEWNRRVMQRLGQNVPLGTWVHLYINGLYWGVYNPTERPDASFSASLLGGRKADYDAIKNHEEALDGNDEAYHELLARIQNDPNNFNAGYRDLSTAVAYDPAAALIDLDMLADYMLHNMYSAATDWPGNNYLGYNRTGAYGGWQFYDWDNEHGLKPAVTINRTTPHSRDSDSPTKFHHALRQHAEYRLLFADRLQRAMFNDGPLSPPHAAALWLELHAQIETALIAESARWGDYRRDEPYTVHTDFQQIRNDLLNNWFPQRTDIVLDQFRLQGLYPLVDAPVFDLAGGVVATNTPLNLDTPSGGDIYYTLDGSDPRNATDNGANTNAMMYTQAISLMETGPVRARVFTNGTWSALDERFYIVGTPAATGSLVVSELMYHPILLDPDHEYIEVENRSGGPLDLTRVRFTAGVLFTFPDGFVLDAGERAVVVDDPVAFANHYGTGARIAGRYTEKLDNGGERIILRAEDDREISNFRYRDSWPWPESPDKSGYSLVYISGDPALPENWRSSARGDGTPGGSDRIAYNADDLLAYAFGPGPELKVDASGQEMHYAQRIGADAVRVIPEWSVDLLHWTDTDLVFSAEVPDGTGQVRWSWELPKDAKGYIRLRVEVR